MTCICSKMLHTKTEFCQTILSDEQSVIDIKKISWLTFLPRAQEQTRSAEDLAALCQRWARYIPALSWLIDYVPEHIPHKHMHEVKNKTSIVITEVLYTYMNTYLSNYTFLDHRCI